MKICLIPQVSVNAVHPEYSVPYVPLGVLCIAGMIDPKVDKTEVMDLTLLVKNGRLRYGKDFEKDAAKLIHSKKFDVVGFSTFSACFHHTLKIAAELKKLSPKTTVVFGGPQATFCAEDVIKNFPVDFVVRGEGEMTFSELVDAIRSNNQFENILGLTYKKGGKVMSTPERPLIDDINKLPYPAYHLYTIYPDTKVPIEMTRGCPFNCTYCSTSLYWGRNVRSKSVERVLLEIKYLQNVFETKLVSFADDTFTIDRKKALKLCETLKNDGRGIKWHCSTRIDKVDPSILKEMADAGCTNIFYGIESGSKKVQKLIKKNIDLKSALKSIAANAKCGIDITASFIMGFPFETKEDLKNTLKLREDIKGLYNEKQTIQLHTLSPDVNTELALMHYKDLAYDTSHSDQAGGVFTSFDKKLILKHKRMFLAYYHFITRHLERKMVAKLSHFMFACHVLAYWSSFYVYLKEKDPLKLFNKWLLDPLGKKKETFESATLFLKKYFLEDNNVPEPIRQLYTHEAELAELKGKIVSNLDMRLAAEQGIPISNKRYSFDPEITMKALKGSIKSLKTLRTSPITYVYSQIGLDDTGPVVSFKKV